MKSYILSLTADMISAIVVMLDSKKYKYKFAKCPELEKRQLGKTVHISQEYFPFGKADLKGSLKTRIYRL